MKLLKGLKDGASRGMLPEISYPAILFDVIHRFNSRAIAGAALLLVWCLFACHKEEQAVVGVAHTAVKAERQAPAAPPRRGRATPGLASFPPSPHGQDLELPWPAPRGEP